MPLASKLALGTSAAVQAVAALLIKTAPLYAQQSAVVTLRQNLRSKEVTVLVGTTPFARFLYVDSLEKPILFDLRAAGGQRVMRGFPIEPRTGEPNDHPHHTGLWLNYENVNGLDFWNNSYAIPAAKKSVYGWIKVSSPVRVALPPKAQLEYEGKWIDQKQNILLTEHTRLQFTAVGTLRTVERTTKLTAATQVLFSDAKDGFLGFRVAHELQMRSKEDQKFYDSNRNETVVKGGHDLLASGTYLTSEGKLGDSAWGTRGAWCKVSGKIGSDSVSVAILDHIHNPNYPTFWHARGYGLFAANPLGQKVFTNGRSSFNLSLKTGESVTFRYLIIVISDKTTLTPAALDLAAQDFSSR